MQPDDSIEKLSAYLLPLEVGIIKSVRDEQLGLRMTSFTTTSCPLAEDDVDLVLLACATACLHEGSESAAAILARDQLTRHPERVGLQELAENIDASDEVLVPRVERYLRFAGYDSDAMWGSFGAAGDVYLGRVHRSIIHPIVGVACVAFFSWVAENYSQMAPVASRCQSLWSDWLNQRRPLVEVEHEAIRFAEDWVSNNRAERYS